MKLFAALGICSFIASLTTGAFAQYQNPYAKPYSNPYPQHLNPYSQPQPYRNPYQQYQINTLQQQQYRQQQINQSNSIKQTCIGGVGAGC